MKWAGVELTQSSLFAGVGGFSSIAGVPVSLGVTCTAVVVAFGDGPDDACVQYQNGNTFTIYLDPNDGNFYESCGGNLVKSGYYSDGVNQLFIGEKGDMNVIGSCPVQQVQWASADRVAIQFGTNGYPLTNLFMSSTISPSANGSNVVYDYSVEASGNQGAAWSMYRGLNGFQVDKGGLPISYSATNLYLYTKQGPNPGGVPVLSTFTGEYIRVRLYPVWLNSTAYCEVIIDAGDAARAPQILSFANYGSIQ